MKSLEINANAKINLALAVKYKRDDGYHELDLIFQEINFSDQLILSKDCQMVFSTDSQELDIESDNICLKAARLLQRDFDIPGINIHLEKKIPLGGGLGGGSSDAAAVLKGLNDIWGLGVGRQKLLKTGEGLGADVPFFVLGCPAIIMPWRGLTANTFRLSVLLASNSSIGASSNCTPCSSSIWYNATGSIALHTSARS